MKLNQKGYVEDAMFGAFVLFSIIGMILLVGLLIFSKVEWSEQNVSGIVYNTKNNTFPGANTKFSVRASVETYVSEENKSSYCLPPDSPYKELVNKAAANKDMKVQVTTTKGFWLRLPFTCIDNVKVVEVK